MYGDKQEYTGSASLGQAATNARETTTGRVRADQEQLEKLVQNLQERFGALRERLEPVLLPNPPTGEAKADSGQPEPQRCEVAYRTHLIKNMVSDLTMLVDDLLRRYDV